MTQKRGLGRGLGALIPGAGPTAPRSTTAPAPAAASPEPVASPSSPAESDAEQATSLRTRNHPRTSPEPGESGAGSRPVDMFFSGDPVGGTERPTRGSGNGRDVAGAMARAAAERRAAKKAPSRSTAAKSAGAQGAASPARSTRATDAEATEATGTERSGARSAPGTTRKRTAATPSAKKTPAKKAPAAKTAAASSAPEAGPTADAEPTATQSTTASSRGRTSATKTPTSRANSATPQPADTWSEPAAAPLEPATADELAATGLEHTPAGIVAGHPADPGPASASTDGAPAPEAGRASASTPAPSAEADADLAVQVETVTPTPAVAGSGQGEHASPAMSEEPTDEGTGTAPTGAVQAEEPATSEQAVAAVSPAAEPPAGETRTDDDATAEIAATDVDDADTDLLPVPGAEFAEIPIHEIRENPRNPRTQFDDDALDELAYSLREVGVLQPVVVRPIPATEAGESFELVMGERRWRAARRAGLASIPAIIRETSDDDLLRDALLENLHRSQLNPLEEAAAYQQLLEDFGCTQDELADRIGRSRPQISNTLRLMKLPPLVQRRLASGVLSAGHARALLSLDNPTLMEELAQRIVAEGLSVRAVERLVSTGAEPARTRATPRRSTYDPHVVDLTSRLSNRLEAPVRIDVGKRKGRITLEFTNLDDLERLIERIGLETQDDGSSEG